MKNLLLVLLLSCAFLHPTFGQNATIKGTISDASSNEPLINATIQIKGTTNGTVTDFDGEYTLSVPSGDVILVFSFIGYEKKEEFLTLSANETKVLNLSLAESEMLLDQVVISASKFEKKLGEETVSMEVIKPQAIENLSLTGAADVVERAPGVTVVDGQANIRGGSGYSFGAGSRVLLLVDGIPAFQADAGRPNWSHIAIENIGQVEIIKGAASALYGSSAMNGIINIKSAYPTSKPYNHVSIFSTFYNNPPTTTNSDGEEVAGKDKAWWLKDEYIYYPGTENADTTDLSDTRSPSIIGFTYAHRQKIKQLDVVIGLNAQTEQSWRFSDFNNQARVNANLRYRLKNKPGMSFGVNTQISGGHSASFFLWENGTDGLYMPAGLTGDPTKTKSFRVSVDPFMIYGDDKGNSHKLLGRYFKIDYYNTNNQNNFGDFLYGEYQYQKHFKKIEKVGIVLTSGVASHYMVSEALLYGGGIFKGRNVALYSQLDLKFFERLNFVIGGRLESNKITSTKAETKPVGRLGLNYQAAEYTYIRASFGQGYRFPTIAEKFIDTDVGAGLAIGANPELTSETGFSAELGIKQGVKLGRNFNGLLDFSGYYTEYNNMIEFGVRENTDPTSTALAFFQANNVGDTRIYGIEVTLASEGKFGNFPATFIAGYNWVKPEFIDFDQEAIETSSAKYNVLKYRFRHTFVTDFGINFNGLEIGAAARYFSFMENTDRAFELVVPSIASFRENDLKDPEENPNDWGPRSFKGDFILDARIGYSFGTEDQAKISFVMKNILNHEYALRPGIVDAPRNYTLRFDVRF